MQDVAREITALLEPSEPSEPLGHRLLLFGGEGCGTVIFEAKAVPFKSGLAFLVRSITSDAESKTIPHIGELPTMFAPTEDALKFLIRRAYNLHWINQPRAVLMPPSDMGHERNYESGAVNVILGPWSRLEVGDYDSHQERTLRETVAALTVMHVPEGLKW